MVSRHTRQIVRGRATTRARWKGRARVRKLLTRLPDTVRGEIVKLFEEKAPVALSYARASTPRLTGALAEALRVKVYPKRLALRLGLIGKAANRQFYYGNILERGRKPRVVRVTRKLRNGGAVQYALRVAAIPAARFDIVFGRVGAFVKNLIGVPARDLWKRSLAQAGGALSDAD